MTQTVAQSTSDLRKYLDECLNFLELSCDAYDRGVNEEAKRLAVTIRVLVHDTSKSISLLQQLGLKTTPFLDTAVPIAGEIIANYHGLISTAVSLKEAKYLPLLGQFPTSRLVQFDQWWSSPVIIDGKENEFSRGDLVLTAANQVGGAHVDPNLNAAYAALSKDNTMNIFAVTLEGHSHGIAGAELATIRQIAHEVLATFKPNYQIATPVFDGFQITGLQLTSGSSPSELEFAIHPRQGRNERCSCQSGKKYKHCHGKFA